MRLGPSVFTFASCSLCDGATMPRVGRYVFSILVVLTVVLGVLPGVGADATGTRRNLLINGSFEGRFQELASGWVENTWGDGAVFTYSRSTSKARKGRSSQQLTVADLGDGGVQFYQAFDAVPGAKYRGAVWLTAPEPVDVQVLLRQIEFPYATIAETTVTLTSNWRPVRVRGRVPVGVDAALFIVALSEGTIYVDSASVAQVAPPVAPPPEPEPTPSPEPTVEPTPSPEVEVPLVDPGFEGSFKNLADGWVENAYGNGFQVSYRPERRMAHSGNQAQRMKVSAIGDGGVQFFHPFPVERRVDYRASIWLRAKEPMQARVMIRYEDAPYIALASRTVSVDTEWVEVSLQGGSAIAVAGALFIEALEPGTLYIDDASVVEVAETPLGVGHSFDVPDTLFGMMMNHQGTYDPGYPTDGGADVGLVRFHDSGLRWNEIELSQDNFVWDEFDRQVDLAQSRGIDVMYTMGLTPAWASARPDELGEYGASNLGTSAEPADFDDWIDYVDTVSRRYAGRIAIYEIWNEVDIPGMYSGSVDQIVELTRLAYSTIKTNDPDAIVLAPNYTQFGVSDFEEFLAAGGDQYVDGYGVHLYSGVNADALANDLPTPEAHIHTMNQFQSVLDSYGITKQIWITEGAVLGLRTVTATRDERLGATARAFLVPLLMGQQTFAWYTWEGIVDGNIELFDPDRGTILEPGMAFATVSNWLRGATVLSVGIDESDVYQIVVSDPDGVSLVLWKPDLSTNSFGYEVPGNATTVFNLDGTSAPIVDSHVRLGPSPIRVAMAN